jgi:hypothetical protein
VRSAAGGRYRIPTRRPPRRSPLVAHPRSASANAEPGPSDNQDRPSFPAADHNVTGPAATQAPLGVASSVRPEPLKPTHHSAEMFSVVCCRTPDRYQVTLRAWPSAPRVLAAPWAATRRENDEMRLAGSTASHSVGCSPIVRETMNSIPSRLRGRGHYRRRTHDQHAESFQGEMVKLASAAWPHRTSFPVPPGGDRSC